MNEWGNFPVNNAIEQTSGILRIMSYLHVAHAQVQSLQDYFTQQRGQVNRQHSGSLHSTPQCQIVYTAVYSGKLIQLAPAQCSTIGMWDFQGKCKR